MLNRNKKSVSFKHIFILLIFKRKCTVSLIVFICYCKKNKKTNKSNNRTTLIHISVRLQNYINKKVKKIYIKVQISKILKTLKRNTYLLLSYKQSS